MSESEPKDESPPAQSPESTEIDRTAETQPAPPEDRRHFLKVVGIGGLGAGLAVVAGAPAVAYVAYPLSHATVSGADDFIPVGHVERFTGSKPVKVDLFADKRDAWNRVVQVKVGSAWVLRHGENLRAFTTVCPHLGCAVDYDGESSKFKCPCHTSIFNLEGAVEGGPSPRAMDELEVKQDGDQVAIKFRRFKQGISEKEVV